MSLLLACPSCGQHCRVPESAVGRRVKCPRCGTPFAINAAEPPRPKFQIGDPLSDAASLSANTPVTKTVLGTSEETIYYGCPRCQMALESPARAVGQKLTCPGCGQRLQVPASTKSGLDKTILAVERQAGSPSVQESITPRPPPLPSQDGRRSDEREDKYCRECGRNVAGRDQLRICPDCDMEFCSAGCCRDHQRHAHGGYVRSEPGVGMAVTGMVLGIVGFVFAFIPCMGWMLAILLGILGTVFSSIGIAQASKAERGKGMAVTGLVLSILAIVWGPLCYFLILGTLAATRAPF